MASHFKKVVCFAFLVFCFTYINDVQAQNTHPGRSKNITTINGKKYYLHKIAHAQSLFGIAKIYNVDINTILAENPSAKKGLIVGQELKIPVETKPTEVVKTPEVIAPPPVVKKEDTPTTSTNSGELDLLSMVDEPNKKKEKEYVTATFKSTRNINFHTSEVLGKRCLDFRIQHRFGSLSSGTINAWGIDGPATLMLSLEYSPNGRWMVGISRCTQDKMAEGFFKWKIIRQVKRGFPFSITYFGGVYNTFALDPFLGQSTEFYNSAHPSDRMSFVNQ